MKYEIKKRKPFVVYKVWDSLGGPSIADVELASFETEEDAKEYINLLKQADKLCMKDKKVKSRD